MASYDVAISVCLALVPDLPAALRAGGALTGARGGGELPGPHVPVRPRDSAAGTLGTAVQVEPMIPMLNAPGTKCLKL